MFYFIGNAWQNKNSYAKNIFPKFYILAILTEDKMKINFNTSTPQFNTLKKKNPYFTPIQDSVSFSGKNLYLEAKKLPPESFPSPELRKEILSALEKDKNANIIQIQKDYYHDLLNCETLEEAQEKFPELKKVKNAKDIKESKRGIGVLKEVKSGRYEDLTLENFSLKLVQLHYAEAISFNTKTNQDRFFGISLTCMNKISKELSIPMDKGYRDLLAAKKQYYNTINQFKNNELLRQSASQRLKERWQNPAYHEKMSQVSKEQWAKPEFREMMRERSVGNWENPEFKEKMIRLTIERWQDPAYHEKMSQLAKANWQDPIYHQRMVKRNKALWQNPTYRKTMEITSKASSLAWEIHPKGKEFLKGKVKEFPILPFILNKESKGIPLDDREFSYKLSYYKACEEEYPTLKKEVGQLQKEILSQWGFYEKDRDIDKIYEAHCK